jgi:hypothetical protein
LRSLGATSCDLLRSSACVGFCVALARDLTFSRGKHRLFSTLLGELSSPAHAPARTDPQDDSSHSPTWSLQSSTRSAGYQRAPRSGRSRPGWGHIDGSS